MRLEDDITSIRFISDSYKNKLAKLNIYKVKDLVTYFPRKYSDSSTILSTSELIKGFNNIDLSSPITLQGRVISFKNTFIRQGKSIQTGIIGENNNQIKIIFFNQPYLINSIIMNKDILLSGKVKKQGSFIVVSANKYEILKDASHESIHLGTIVPEYKLTSGISAKWLRNRISETLKNLNEDNFISNESLNAYKNISRINYFEEIKNVHFPENYTTLGESVKQLSTVELTDLSLKTIQSRIHLNHSRKFKIKDFKKLSNEFISKLDFKLTKDQSKVVFEICNSIESKVHLNSLLQGDVGTGKTIITVLLSYIYSKNKLKIVFISPTSILAEQTYLVFNKFLKDFEIDISIRTSNKKKPIINSDIIIGTTAILWDNQIDYSKVGLLIVDEQHKFGVKQREEILKRRSEGGIDFLSMTATPIPRTVAEALFGELEVFNINLKPGKRKTIKTFAVFQDKFNDLIGWIGEKIASGNQAYWVCPLVEESIQSDSIAVKSRFEFIKKMFPERGVEVLYGKMKENDKNNTLTRFKNRETDILVATSVIEVGVDIPGATIMIVDSPENFGLASLHQIRGRVGRNDLDNFCFLICNDNMSQEAKNRLEFFEKENDGNKIAEYDLKRRGPGEVYGTIQSGIPDLKIAKLNDINAIKKAKEVARELYYEHKIKRIYLFE